jgi:hypothetical protein
MSAQRRLHSVCANQGGTCASGDQRPSLEGRYGTHKAYVEAVRAAAEKAVGERFLLRDDAGRLIAEAAASDVLKDRP